MIRFENDYAEGTYPEILMQLQKTNLEQTEGYGTDSYCSAASERMLSLCRLTKEEADVHFIPGGTQTNLTVLSAALRPHHGVICADTGHIATHEGGAVEATGHKVLTIPNTDGKLTADQIRTYMENFFADETNEHQVRPAMVYISDLTELGTAYGALELKAISDVCHTFDLLLYLDGARLGYSLCIPSCDKTLPDIARCCDVFTFGGTKIGALFGEAVIIRNPWIRRDFRTILKQKGGLFAKGRLLGIQFQVLLTDEFYRIGCGRAVHLADDVREAVRHAGFGVCAETYGNQIFPILPDSLVRQMEKQFTFSLWAKPDATNTTVRICTSWATAEADTDALCRMITSYRAESGSTFDAKAASWDTDLRKRRTDILAREIRSEIGSRTDLSAMEFGCGTGLVGMMLADAFAKLTFTDSSVEMIRIVEGKIQESGRTNLRAVTADYTDGDRPEEAYDLIFTSMALHHIKDTRAILRTLTGALRPGGRLVVIDLYPVDPLFHSDEKNYDGHHGFVPSDLAEMLAAECPDIRYRSIYSATKPVRDTEVPYSLFLLSAEKKG